MKKIGILGAGNAGLTLYVLILKQHKFEPILFASPEYLRTFKLLKNSCSPISFYSKSQVSIFINESEFKITHSLNELISNCNVIVNTLPINVHIQYFDQLYEILLKRGKKIDLINLSGGFAIFDHILKQKANPVVRIASSHTLPFASRVSEGQIKILNRRSNTPVSISQETLIPVVKYFEELIRTPLPINNNPLFTSIDRSSYVLHPLITMMNFTKIEKNQKFYFYRDGLTKSVEKMLIEAGHERMALCQELGFNDFISPENRVKNFIDTYMDDFENVLPPTSANHRFFTEDIPYGLVFQCSLGRYLNIKMPLSESLITFSSSICNQDFWQSPFNLLHRSNLLDIVLSFKKIEKI